MCLYTYMEKGDFFLKKNVVLLSKQSGGRRPK